MAHVDEGEVHAWLDGELAPDEGARLEAHIDSCADCSALVAEARGLVAASSRILEKLDGVPAGVIPAKSAATPRTVVDADDARRTAAGGLRPKRAWLRRPQYAAAAAIAFIAVATSVVARRQRSESVRDFAPLKNSAVEQATDAAPIAEIAPRTDSVVQLLGGAASDRASAAGAASAGKAEQGAAASGAVAAVTVGARVALSASWEKAVVRSLGDSMPSQMSAKGRSAEPSTPVASAAPASAVARGMAKSALPAASLPERAPAGEIAKEAGARTRVADAARDEAARVTAAPEVDASSARRADSARQPQRLSPRLSPDQLVRNEGRRLEGESKIARDQAVVTGAGGAAATSSVPAVVPSRLVGCYRLELFAAALAAGVAERVALEETVVGMDGSRPLYLARSLVAASGDRTLWRWTLSAQGEVGLLRGAGTSAVRYAIALPGTLRTGDAIAATRIECPRR